MLKSEPKTKPTKRSVAQFLAAVKDEDRRRDCKTVLSIMKDATKSAPQMWGPSIVGFGTYHYVGASGREGDWPRIAFSPRKVDLTLFIMPGFDQYAELMRKLGKVKTGKACLYIKSLDDVHLPTLMALINQAVAYMKRRYP